MAAPRFVICLCAQWCRVCRQYRIDFEALADKHAARAFFLWLDIEELESQIESNGALSTALLDIETFPTLAIAQGEELLFFGDLPPQITALERIMQAPPAAMRAAHDRHPSQEVWAELHRYLVKGKPNP